MNKFQKITKSQFIIDVCGSEIASGEEAEKAWELIELPCRSTANAAGYDIRSPFAVEMKAGVPVLIPTGVSVNLDDDKFLAILPRSGMGFKYGLRLANTVGVIDADYINAKNEGHIMLKLVCDKDFVINAGDRVAQGIIMPYYKTSDDNAEGERVGGFGSTGK